MSHEVVIISSDEDDDQKCADFLFAQSLSHSFNKPKMTPEELTADMMLAQSLSESMNDPPNVEHNPKRRRVGGTVVVWQWAGKAGAWHAYTREQSTKLEVAWQTRAEDLDVEPCRYEARDELSAKTFIA